MEKWDNRQHEFTKGISCWLNLISFLDKIIDFQHKENEVDVNSLDFNKAFDIVPQGKLFVNLEKMGFSIRTLRMIG